MSLSVLIADDSKTVREMLKLELPGLVVPRTLRITEAVDGREALNLLADHDYDLAFLDLTMPELSGYEVLKELEKEGIRRKIVVLTADVQPRAKSIVRDLGAVGYLGKPFDRDSTKALLEEIDFL